MYTRQKWYLNFQKQKILVFMNDYIITFKLQQIYKNNRSFKRAMKELHDKKLILINQQRKGNEYMLTDKGKQLGRILNELAK